MKYYFICIPKSASTSICEAMGQEHSHRRLTLTNEDHPLMVIRNPLDFYESLYNFLNNSNKKITNQMLVMANSMNINEFIQTLLDKKKFSEYIKEHNIPLSDYDITFCDENENIGLYSHYLKFFCNPHNYKTIKEVILYMNEHIKIIKFENIDCEFKLLGISLQKLNISEKKIRIQYRIRLLKW